MSYSESFLGGFASGFLGWGFFYGGAAAGIYATTNRIIGVRLTTTTAPNFLGGGMAGLVQGQLMPRLSADDSARVIQELDQKKDFEISKEQISTIKIKAPGMMMTTGQLVIKSKAGQETKISVRHKIAFERLRDLMRAFYPEAVKLG